MKAARNFVCRNLAFSTLTYPHNTQGFWWARTGMGQRPIAPKRSGPFWKKMGPCQNMCFFSTVTWNSVLNILVIVIISKAKKHKVDAIPSVGEFFSPHLTICQMWKCATSDILLSHLTNFVRHNNVTCLTFLPHVSHFRESKIKGSWNAKWAPKYYF